MNQKTVYMMAGVMLVQIFLGLILFGRVLANEKVVNDQLLDVKRGLEVCSDYLQALQK